MADSDATNKRFGRLLTGELWSKRKLLAFRSPCRLRILSNNEGCIWGYFMCFVNEVLRDPYTPKYATEYSMDLLPYGRYVPVFWEPLRFGPYGKVMGRF